MSWKNKVVLITGASTGIGRSIALAFAEKGATVGLLARRADKLQEVEQEVRQLGGNSIVLPADISDDEALFASVDRFIRETNRLDVLVNNAGIGVFGRVPTNDELDKIFSINVKAMFKLSHYVLPYLEQTKGTVINLGSTVVDRPFAGEIAYMASKGAVAAMTKGMAASWGSRGVRVNLVEPGIIKTDFNQAAGLPRGLDEQMYEASIQLNVLPTTGRVEDIANVVVFLASDQSRFITGACMKVDGGLSLGTIKPE